MAKRILEEVELGPRAAAGARAALKRIEHEVPSAVLEDIRLLVSELVTNSYRHGGAGPGSKATVTVEIDGGCVHVDVEDGGSGFVAAIPNNAPPDRPSGWGLMIVDRIADRWGVTRDRGTHVWFELATKGRGIPARSA